MEGAEFRSAEAEIPQRAGFAIGGPGADLIDLAADPRYGVLDHVSGFEPRLHGGDTPYFTATENRSFTGSARRFRGPRFPAEPLFNAFGARQPEHPSGPVTRSVRTDRSQERISPSPVRNRFMFRHDGPELSPGQAYDLFTPAIRAEPHASEPGW